MGQSKSTTSNCPPYNSRHVGLGIIKNEHKLKRELRLQSTSKYIYGIVCREVAESLRANG